MEAAVQLGWLGCQMRWAMRSNGKRTGQEIRTGIFPIPSFFYSAIYKEQSLDTKYCAGC